MKIPKKMTIPEVTREEHISLINSLDKEYEYIFLFDSRVRVAIVHDMLHNTYIVLVCGLSGAWYTIDTCRKETAYDAYLSTAHAVASAYIEDSLDKDLEIIGVKRADA